MEILHYCTSNSFSGLEQYAFEMALQQKKLGRRVGFVVIPGSRLEMECCKNQIQTIPFDPYAGFLATLRFWKYLKNFIVLNPSLRVLHFHSTQGIAQGFGALFWTRLRYDRPKIILQIHIWMNHSKKDVFHKAVYSVVDEIWCSSQPAKRTLERLLPSKTIRIVNYGRNVQDMEIKFLDSSAARTELGLPGEALIIGCVSRLEASKGIQELVHACSELMREGHKFHLAVIGAASPDNSAAAKYEEELRTWITLQSDVKDQIHLLGPKPDAFKFMKAFDIYVLPSYEECFSLALLDAQLAGLPVIGTQSGGTPEVVIPGQTGWLTRPMDTKSLKEAIKTALDDQKKWTQFGMKARARVISDFDQKLVSEAILKGYDAVLERKTTP